MNRPTTRTEQMLASASKGVSSRLILAEAARFVEPGEIFVVGLIQGSSGRLASPRAFHCSRVCVLTGVYQTPVPRRVFRTVWYCGRVVGQTVNYFVVNPVPTMESWAIPAGFRRLPNESIETVALGMRSGSRCFLHSFGISRRASACAIQIWSKGLSCFAQGWRKQKDHRDAHSSRHEEAGGEIH